MEPAALRALVGLLCAPLPLALALQYVVYQRNPLAAQNPALRLALSGLCAALGCTIAAPQNIGMVVVAGSAFNQETAPGRYRLGLSVRNQASSIVATPALELTLTGMPATSRWCAKYFCLPSWACRLNWALGPSGMAPCPCRYRPCRSSFLATAWSCFILKTEKTEERLLL